MKAKIVCGCAAFVMMSGLAPAQEPAVAFGAICAARADAAASMTVPGRDGWFFLMSELRHIGAGPFWGEAAAKVSQATRPDARDPLPAILSFKTQLDQHGIELILVPVPPKAFLFPDKLSDQVTVKGDDEPPRLDVNLREFYRLLAEKGVTVLDLWPEFAPVRLGPEGPMYCRTDTHWSGMACVRVARRLAAELAKRPWLADTKRTKFDTEEKEITVRGDLIVDLKPLPAGESLRLRYVGTRTAAGLTPVPDDARSPVLVLADSHGLVFHAGGDLLASGAGLTDQLACELGFAVDMIASRGDGITTVRADLIRKARADPAWLAAKKVVIWCFTAREFTESSNGWRVLPPFKKTE
jgi:alginate O-acetyltransferase complex protein AlgJ